MGVVENYTFEPLLTSTSQQRLLTKVNFIPVVRFAASSETPLGAGSEEGRLFSQAMF